MKRKIFYVVLSILICCTIGFLSSIVTQSSVNDWYLTLNKPNFNPPNWIFAPVWTTMYILMGISAGWVWAKGFHHKWVKTGLYHFGFQLLLNGLWSIIFFGLKQPFLALLVILALIVVLILTIKWFGIVSKVAAILLIPYLLWLCFAAVLNYKIWEMN
ncbi:TspO/MBR family protein [Maribacter hydrothermalis]|uniref:Sensory protein TspO n=1 Tax=Maribacter hydrothermalis TaxID=1836467 RepID=A0A1B7Z3B0_9FLAO|nr:TspO/MBR family protein [Maribacter hydrothermalis]APQ16944.1 sensory protein TspO [Maribacter hydrothermalis]OBR37205.1 sensory protein TspO [Maribacter hydrothermalis]